MYLQDFTLLAFTAFCFMVFLTFIVWVCANCDKVNLPDKNKIERILQKVKFNKDNDKDEGIICLKKLNLEESNEENIQKLGCGYKFYKICIVEWLSQNPFSPLFLEKIDKNNDLDENNPNRSNETNINNDSSNVVHTFLSNVICSYQCSKINNRNNNSSSLEGSFGGADMEVETIVEGHREVGNRLN